MAHCGSFWATVELLVSLGRKSDSNCQPFNEEIEDWLDSVSSKADLRLPFSSKESIGDDKNYLADYHPPIECNITHPTVKSRLEGLMGSNIVKLTDRKYMLKLMSKIRQDHEAKQQVRIEERMKEEVLRTKMMILNRLIPIQDAPENIRQHPLFQLYLYCDSIIHGTHKKKNKKLVRVRESLYRMLYSNEQNSEKSEEEFDEEEDLYLKKMTFASEQEEKKDIEDDYVVSQEDYDRLHYETDGVKSLRNAKTVEEMYEKAHAIVGILKSYADEERRNQEINDGNVEMTTDKQKKIPGNEEIITEIENTENGKIR